MVGGGGYLRNCVGVYKKHIRILDNNIVKIKRLHVAGFMWLRMNPTGALVNAVTKLPSCIPCIRV